MAVAAIHKYIEGAYWARIERKEFGGSDQKCFVHYTFYVGYNVSNVFIVS